MLNIAPHVADLVEVGVDHYQKPIVMGEFGVESGGG
jgi:hypothetical protein